MLRPLATVREDPDGRLAITVRYSRRPGLGESTRWICPGDEHFGVSFAEWRRSVGKRIDLTKWEGNGPGMIGGPARLHFTFILACEDTCHVATATEHSLRRQLRQLRRSLRDPDVEYGESALVTIQCQIDRRLRRLRWIREWRRGNPGAEGLPISFSWEWE